MEQIAVAVHVDEKAFIRLNYFMSYRNPLLLFLTAIGLAAAFYCFYVIGSDGIPYTLFDLILSVLLSVYILVFTPVRIGLRSRRVFRKTPKAVNVTYFFTSEGFRATGEGLEVSHTWKQVHSVREIGSWYMIYLGPNRAHYIPASCFSSPEQEKAFRKLVLNTGRPARFKRSK